VLERPLLDDAEVVVAVAPVDAPRVEPLWASGSRVRTISSLAGTEPTPGQNSSARMPSRAAAKKFSVAAANDSCRLIGSSRSISARTSPR
jgi:hypothetical protein